MDTELFNNITDNMENSSFNPNESYAFPINYYGEIPTAIVAVLSTVANAIIIFLTIRFQELHTKLYFYLANWCSCNFVITASAHSSLNSLGLTEIISTTTLCIWSEIEFVFIYANLMFAAALILDWYITTFSSQGYCALYCRRHYKAVAVVVWSSVLVLVIKSILYCLEFVKLPVLALLVCVSYLMVTLLILVISVLRMIKLKVSSIIVEKSNIEFKIALSHFLCWLPNLMLLALHMAIHNFAVVEYISYIIWYSNACVIFLILYFEEENFRFCLGKVFNTKFSTSRKDNKDIPLMDM